MQYKRIVLYPILIVTRVEEALSDQISPHVSYIRRNFRIIVGACYLISPKIARNDLVKLNNARTAESENVIETSKQIS